MNLLKPLTPSLLALALAACAVGPDYQAPATEPAQLSSDVQAKAYDRSRFESLWWKQFDDPVLNQLVQASLDGNRDLRVAFARLKSARSIREDAENDPFPVVTSRASSDLGKGQIPGQTTERVNSERYDLGLDMAWELDLFGRIQRQIEASEAQEAVAAADLQQLQVSLIAELVDAYGQLRGAQLREKIALANLKTQQESRTITETLRDAGVGNDLDVVRADARLAGVEATVPQLQAEQARARHRIATLLGQRPDALSVDLSPKALPAIAKALPVGDPGELLRRRPDIRSAERQLAAATANVGVATADLFPRVSLSGFLGFTAARGSHRLFGGQRLGTGPEHYLGGLRPGQRAGPPARRQGRCRRGTGQLRTAGAAGTGRVGQRLQRLRQDPTASAVADAPERRQPQGCRTGLDSLSRRYRGLPGTARCRT